MGGITGQQLVDQLRSAAARAGVSLREFVEPLAIGRHPHDFIRQLEIAKAPKIRTIERVEALIAGAAIPPAPQSPFKGCVRGNRRAPTAGEAALRRDEIEYRRALAEAAHAGRRPGETLQQAVKRISGERKCA